MSPHDLVGQAIAGGGSGDNDVTAAGGTHEGALDRLEVPGRRQAPGTFRGFSAAGVEYAGADS